MWIMPLSCQPFQRGSHPRACRTRSQIKTLSHAMENQILAVSSQRNDVGSLHTVNVIFPKKSRPSHSVTFGKGEDLMFPDRSRNHSSTKINDIHPNAEVSAVPAPVPNPLIQAQSPVAEHTSPLPDSPHTVAGDASSSVFVYPAVLLYPLLCPGYRLQPLLDLAPHHYRSPCLRLHQRSGPLAHSTSTFATNYPTPTSCRSYHSLGDWRRVFVASILILTKLCLDLGGAPIQHLPFRFSRMLSPKVRWEMNRLCSAAKKDYRLNHNTMQSPGHGHSISQICRSRRP
ncbi:hypothetical protein BGY98DRAFT_27591 [Russula aff. rugulosa BPL654]|nr:hypothetical protein BGY98DRAFT_27591 [Russula aff. rugulosa BPL654]